MDISKQFEEYSKSKKSVAIYGAGIVGYGICEALEVVYGIETQSYITSELPANGCFAGKKLYSVMNLPSDIKGLLIVVATPEVYHGAIAQEIRENKISQYCFLTYMDIYEVMRRFYAKEYLFESLEDLNIQDSIFDGVDLTCSIFMAKHVNDIQLKNSYRIPDFIRPIQAGALLSERKTDDLGDDQGDNISSKNNTYSELTVTYWVWKNCHSDYKGICHYRRFLDLSSTDYQNIFRKHIDAVLPLPSLCLTDSSFQWKRYVAEDDMSLLLKTMGSEDRKATEDILSYRYIYNHNLVLAKQDVFDDYCSWIFGILFHAEEAFIDRDGGLKPRLMGYLGEILTSAYFSEREKLIRIVHAPECWMT